MKLKQDNDDLRATWFGRVSPTWKLGRAKNAFRIISKKVGERHSEHDLLSLTLKGIIRRDVDSGKGKFPESFDTYQEVKKSDIVFCLFDVDETPRTVGLSRFDGMITGAYTVVRCAQTVDPRFVTYFYLSIDERKGLRPFYTGLRKVVRTETFLNATFPFPDLSAQREIADFLDRETARIDLLIEKKQKLVALLGEKAKSVNELFFINSDATGTQPLHRVYWVVTGKTPSRNEEDNFSDEEGLPWATPANLGFLAPVVTTKEYLTAKGSTGQPAVDAGTVLLNGIGASVGKIGIAGTKLSFNQQIHALIAKKRVLSDRFLFFQLLTLKDQLVLLANSTTLPILNAERLGRLELKIFDLEDQRRHCTSMDALLQHEENTAQRITASIDRLKEYRSALITAAVTGQIDVTTYTKSGTTNRRLDAIQEEMGV